MAAPVTRSYAAEDLPPAATALLSLVAEDEPLTPLDDSVQPVRPVRTGPVRDELTVAIGRLFPEVWDTTLAMLTASDGASVARLLGSVVRPLAEALARRGAGPNFTGATGDGPPGDRLWRLALDATRLRVQPGVPAEFVEATAALQDLAYRAAPADSAPARLAQLRQLQAGLAPGIQS